MPPLSLKARLLLFLFVPLILLLGVIGGGVFGAVSSAFEAKMQEEVELIARTLERPITYSLSRERSGSIEDALQTAFVFERVYGAYLYDKRGYLLAKAGSGRPAGREEPRFARIVDLGIAQGTYETFDGEAVFSYFIPLESASGEPLGLLQVTRSHSEMREILASLERNFIMGYTFFCLGFIGLLILGHRFSIERPLQSLSMTMHRIERGEKERRATVDGPRELQELAGSFNRMLYSLERQQSEITQMDAQEAELKRRLKNSEKLAVLGEMAGSIGHEIGTPLATIDGLAQREQRKITDKSDTRKTFETIRHEVKRLEHFIRELMSFGEGKERTFQATPILPLLQEVIKNTGNSQTGTEIAFRIPEAGACSVKVSAEPLRLQIALKNILRNAQQSKPASHVICSLEFDAEYSYITVDDDGPGIPPEAREVIFEPFVSSRKACGGRGLGLTLAERIIIEHGGKVFVDRAPIGGARFLIQLPLCH